MAGSQHARRVTASAVSQSHDREKSRGHSAIDVASQGEPRTLPGLRRGGRTCAS
jgi:hypothetical protein